MFREWILGISGCSLIVALAITSTPEGAVKKVVRLAGGILIILAVLSPVKNLKDISFSFPVADLSIDTDSIGVYGREAMIELIESQTSAYIKKQVEDIEISVRVICSEEGLYPYPYYISITCGNPNEVRNILEKWIEITLDVPASRQRYFEQS